MTTLSLLFKHLSKHLISELQDVCNWCSPLLAHKRKYIREFVAESLAFLFRKLKGKQLRRMVRGLILSTDASVTGDEKEDEDIINGIATLLFEVVKNVQNQFHSQTNSVLRAMFRCLGQRSTTSTSTSTSTTSTSSFSTSISTTTSTTYSYTPNGSLKASIASNVSDVVDVKGKIVLNGLHRMMEHTRASHANVVWEELFQAIQYYNTPSSSSSSKKNSNSKNKSNIMNVQETQQRMEGLSATLRCLAQCARHRYGTRVMRGSQSAGSMHAVLSNVLDECVKHANEPWMPKLFDANLHGK